MHDLDFLIDQQISGFLHRDYVWIVTFDPHNNLTVACLWRLLENGRIRFTSSDDGQQFGLPAPVDAAVEVAGRVTGARITHVVLRENTLDLQLQLSTGHVLEVIPDSSGYESWQANHNAVSFIAVGGGELTIFGAATGGG